MFVFCAIFVLFLVFGLPCFFWLVVVSSGCVVVGGCCGWLRGWGGFLIVGSGLVFWAIGMGCVLTLGGFFGCLGWCVVCFLVFLESLILAQDERWRRA